MTLNFTTNTTITIDDIDEQNATITEYLDFKLIEGKFEDNNICAIVIFDPSEEYSLFIKELFIDISPNKQHMAYLYKNDDGEEILHALKTNAYSVGELL